jgi:hypothetical protein
LLGYESNRFNTLLEVISRRGSTVIESANDALKLISLLDYPQHKAALLAPMLNLPTLSDDDKMKLRERIPSAQTEEPSTKYVSTEMPLLLKHITRFNTLVKIAEDHGGESLERFPVSEERLDKDSLRQTYIKLARMFHPDTAPNAIREKYDPKSLFQRVQESYEYIKENAPNALRSESKKVHYTQVPETVVSSTSYRWSVTDQGQAIGEAEALRQKKSWSLKDLSSAFRGSLIFSSPLPTVPDSIDFEPFNSTILGLSQLTSDDGRERGKVVFIDIKNKQLIAGTTAIGDEDSVTIKSTIPTQYVERLSAQVLVIHTHPVNSEDGDWSLHFSPQDIKSFMQSDVFGSLVIAGDKALFALKSSNSKTNYDPQKFSLGRWWLEVSSQTPQVYTQKICKALGLNLYLIDFEQGDWTARKVEIKNGATSKYRAKEM